ncbi:hypothetical protein [Crossiella sp. CA198]|uniref:hypothetical protein n=1 Tax=Crossiella sp. CA198 TaxID=3455607 RepID=UPI003F8D4378
MVAIASGPPLVTELPTGAGGPWAARWRRLLVVIPVIVVAREAIVLLAGWSGGGTRCGCCSRWKGRTSR